jgi:predicted dehydrogenase
MGIRIAVQPSIGQYDKIVEMLRFVRGVECIADVAAADGLITDDPVVLKQSDGSDQFALLLSPFQVDAGRLGDLAASEKVVPALHARSQPAVRQIKSEIDAGNLGQPGLLRSHDWDRSYALDDQRLAAHLDVAVWCFDQLPSVVYAVSRRDYVQMHLGFEGDGMAILDVDAGDSLGGSYQSLHLIGSRGAAYADDHENVQLAIDVRGIEAVPTPQGDAALVNMLRAFYEVIRSGDSQQAEWRHVMEINRLVGAVHQSVAQQRPITLESSNG